MISFVLCLGKPVGREGEERAMRGIEQKTRYEHRYILGGRKGRTSDTVVLPPVRLVVLLHSKGMHHWLCLCNQTWRWPLLCMLGQLAFTFFCHSVLLCDPLSWAFTTESL